MGFDQLPGGCREQAPPYGTPTHPSLQRPRRHADRAGPSAAQTLAGRAHARRPRLCFLVSEVRPDQACRCCRCQPRSTCCISQRRAERSLRTARTLACAQTSTPRNTPRSYSFKTFCAIFSLKQLVKMTLNLLSRHVADQRSECGTGMDRAGDAFAIRGKSHYLSQ